MAFLPHVPKLHSCELQALRLDGELSHFYSYVEYPDGPRERARRILGRFEELIVLSSFSAAWAWGCSAEPAIHFASYRDGRVHIPSHSGLTVEQRTLSGTDIAWSSTTPLRTACDLLKSDAGDELVLTTVHALMDNYAVTSEKIWEQVNRNKTASYKRLIAQRLLAISRRYPSDTR